MSKFWLFAGMKHLNLAILFFLFAPSVHAADSWQGKVAEVSGGSVLKIARIDGQIEELHLYAIRVHPHASPEGRSAQRKIMSWCHQWDNVAKVTPMGQDKAGRPIARIIVGGEDLANILAKACLASVDMDLCRKRSTPDCVGWQAWELQCRDEKKGLWATQ